ncbi:Hypothetical protein NTJ_02992 [Nesidiocoris tenuis]|uniref:Uncharacterized protein n=1 Tax=Nesidiocoris tenuis TaxID=355587 RepID=A0ABN7AFP3_9HEMI|nr:Hypothetical protein NTJ_02992 [Nesidiocoris tenuis]
MKPVGTWQGGGARIDAVAAQLVADCAQYPGERKVRGGQGGGRLGFWSAYATIGHVEWPSLQCSRTPHLWSIFLQEFQKIQLSTILGR